MEEVKNEKIDNNANLTIQGLIYRNKQLEEKIKLLEKAEELNVEVIQYKAQLDLMKELFDKYASKNMNNNIDNW